MSRDIYEHRHTFEESGPFPDFKSIEVKTPSGQVFVCTTLNFDKDKIKPVVMRGGIVTDNSSDEERSNEIKQLGQAYSKIRSKRLIELLKIPYEKLSDIEKSEIRMYRNQQGDSIIFNK